MKYWNFYPFEGKILVKNAGPYQERPATSLHVVLCSQAAILYSKYQFRYILHGSSLIVSHHIVTPRLSLL